MTSPLSAGNRPTDRVPLLKTAASRFGISAAARARNTGVPPPCEGAAKTVAAACEFNDAVRVPEPVTLEVVTLKIEGKLRPTDVTDPVAGVAHEKLPFAST